MVEARLLESAGDGLAADACFVERLDTMLASQARAGGNLGLLVLGLDDRQLILDALGRDAHAAASAAIAARLSQALRPGDALGVRDDGRFIVACPSVAEPRDLLAVAERLQTSASSALELTSRQLFPTVSAGMTLALGNETAQQLLDDAASALAEAAAFGPGTARLYDPALRARLVQRLEIEHGLRLALERDELRLHYQPQFATDDGALVALEALVRWEHPQRGLLEPCEFIAIAERSGLIVPLGDWVLRVACKQAAAWMSQMGRHFQLAVNVSARQLEQPDFVASVAAALDGAGLAPERLCLEVTETALLGGLDAPLGALAAIRELGVRLSIDDFGVGFSSLSRLRELLPVHQLKVDRSFISRLVEEADTRAIVAAVVSLATSLGVEAVAEGIEEDAQLAEVAALGCGLSQGFLLARPCPAEGIPELLISRAAPGM